MKSNSSLFFSVILPIVLGLVLPLSHLTGCAGGVTGTGDIRETRVEGRVFKTDGAPLEGATVTLVETGDSVTTNAQGEFLIRTEDLVAGDLTLSVVAATVNAAVGIGSVSEAEPNIRVELQVDEANNSIEIISQSKPTPIPISSSASSSSVSSEPNEPTFTPVPTPLPSASPSATQTIVPTPSPTARAPRSTFKGKVKRSDNGNPVGLVTIMIIETGSSTESDLSGNFEIDTRPVSGDVTIEVSFRGKSAQATINAVPLGTSLVTFDILYTPLNAPANPPDFAISISALEFSS